VIAVVDVVTDQSFESFVQAQEPVLVDFWAPWCGPCKMLGPVVEQLSSELSGQMKFGKLNVDDNPNTASKFGIMGIPTLLVFKGGEVVRQITGYYPKDQLQARLADLLPSAATGR
jgi:thioredoxin 1